MALAVGAVRLAAADADHVEAVRAGLEGPDHGGGDAERVPGSDLDHLAVELGAPRARDDDVDLLLLTVPVPPGHARARLVGEPADTELGRPERGPREAPLHRHVRRADVAQRGEVLPGPVVHVRRGADAGRRTP